MHALALKVKYIVGHFLFPPVTHNALDRMPQPVLFQMADQCITTREVVRLMANFPSARQRIDIACTASSSD